MLSSSASASETVPRRSEAIEPRSRSVTVFVVACVMAALGAARGRADVVFGATETRVNKFTPGQQRMVAADADGSGNFVVVWASASQDGSGYGVFGQRFNSAAVPIGTEFRVNSFTVGDQKRPAVAVDKTTGNFLVAWQSPQGGSVQDVFAQRYAAGGVPAGSEFEVSVVVGGYHGFTRAAAGGGGFVVVWQDGGQDGSSYGVYAQRISGSGAMLGTQFRVNTYTTGNQFQPAVASDAAGNFVVVWQSYRQVTLGWSIHGQRFDSTGSRIGGEFVVSSTAQATTPSVAVGASKILVLWETTPVSGTNLISGAVLDKATGAFVRTEFPITSPTTLSQTQPVAVGSQSDSFFDLFVETDPASQFSIIDVAQTDGNGTTGAKTRVNAIQQPAFEPAGAPTSSGGVFAQWSMLTDVYGRVGTVPGGATPTPTPIITPTRTPTPTPTPTVTPTPTSCSCSIGDANGDCKIDVLDVFYLINYLFAGGARPICNSDVDNSHKVDVADVFYLINYLFAGGPPPV
jgi:hypothetical protein